MLCATSCVANWRTADCQELLTPFHQKMCQILAPLLSLVCIHDLSMEKLSRYIIGLSKIKNSFSKDVVDAKVLDVTDREVLSWLSSFTLVRCYHNFV